MDFTSPTRRIRLAAGLLLSLWIAGLSPVSAEDASIEGGVSPNKRLEVRRVRLVDGPLKGSYSLHLFDNRNNESIKELHSGGYFAYDEAVAGACAAFWHPSGRYVALFNVEKKDVSSLFLFAVEGTGAKEISMPDYALRVLQKFKEGKRGFYDGPQVRWPEWIGNELQFRVVFRVPPPRKVLNTAAAEYESFVSVKLGEQNGRLQAELIKISHPTLVAEER